MCGRFKITKVEKKCTGVIKGRHVGPLDLEIVCQQMWKTSIES